MIVETFTTVATLNSALTQPNKFLAFRKVYVTMKRSVSNIDAVQQSRYSCCISKHRKTRHVSPESRRTSPPPSNSTSQLSHASPQQFALTKEALENTQQPVSDEHTPSIQHWIETCTAKSDPDMMATQPIPRSAPVTFTRGRRPSRHSARASRTPSPNKRPSLQPYRTENMYYAGVLIDDLIELLLEISRRVRHILEAESLQDVIGTMEHESQLATHVDEYLNQSRRNAKRLFARRRLEIQFVQSHMCFSAWRRQMPYIREA